MVYRKVCSEKGKCLKDLKNLKPRFRGDRLMSRQSQRIRLYHNLVSIYRLWYEFVRQSRICIALTRAFNLYRLPTVALQGGSTSRPISWELRFVLQRYGGLTRSSALEEWCHKRALLLKLCKRCRISTRSPQVYLSYK